MQCLVLNKRSKSTTTWTLPRETDAYEPSRVPVTKPAATISSDSSDQAFSQARNSFANSDQSQSCTTSVNITLDQRSHRNQSLDIDRPQRGIKPPPVFPKTFRNGTVSDKQRADSLPGATETGSSTDSTASNWDGFEPSDSSSTTTATMQSTMEARRAFLAPSNPPPPVPIAHLKNGSPLKLLNGTSTHETNITNGMSHGDQLNKVKLNSLETAPKIDLKLPKVPPKVENSSTVSSADFNTSTATTVPKSEKLKTLQLNGHVGFDSLPHQLVRKCTEQGFQFNLMCVGETGMGKTTLIESLFNMQLDFPPCNNELKTVNLLSHTYDVVEGGIRLKLTIVETAGFGDQLDKDKSAEVIVDYINEQFEKYLKEELKIKRCLDYYDDTRIHACLYFISPTGHGLKALDVTTMRLLSERVNVIPVIAKADTTCKDELVRFKKKILSELESNQIQIYQFPTDDETVRAINVELNRLVPYAIVGSTDFVKKENGKMVRARRYPWGIVEVENEEHCDFVKLREAILRTNVDSLRERTHRVLYEKYRRSRLRAMKVGDGDTGPKMMEAFAEKQREFHEEMAKKDKDMRENFIARVSSKEEEMKRREELNNMRAKEISDNFDEEMKRLETQIQHLMEERQKLEAKAGKKVRK